MATQSNQDAYTHHVMNVFKYYRELAGLGFSEVARQVSELVGDPVSASEYRAAEQHITRNPPMSLVLRAALVLDVPLGELWEV